MDSGLPHLLVNALETCPCCETGGIVMRDNKGIDPVGRLFFSLCRLHHQYSTSCNALFREPQFPPPDAIIAGCSIRLKFDKRGVGSNLNVRRYFREYSPVHGPPQDQKRAHRGPPTNTKPRKIVQAIKFARSKNRSFTHCPHRTRESYHIAPSI